MAVNRGCYATHGSRASAQAASEPIPVGFKSIAAMLERPVTEKVLTHLGLRPQAPRKHQGAGELSNLADPNNVQAQQTLADLIESKAGKVRNWP